MVALDEDSVMKIKLGVASALGLLLSVLAAPAAALEITATYLGIGNGGNVQRAVLNSSSNPNFYSLGAGQMQLDIVSGALDNFDLLPLGDQVIAYCIEPQETVASTTYTITDISQAPTNIGGMGVARSQDIHELLFHVPIDAFSPTLTDEDALALQIALWEISRETEASYILAEGIGGNVQFRNPSIAGAIGKAQGWLDSYVNDDPNDGINDGYDPDLLALIKVGNQDLLVKRVHSVPAPASWLLVLPLLWWLRRRVLAHA